MVNVYMNTVIIILGIVVVLLAYYIYTIITATPVVIKKLDLSESAPAIPPSKISDPYSVNYTIGVWVYINNFSSQIDRFLMFGDNTYKGAQSLFSLRMDTRSNNLYADILVNKMTTPPASIPTPTILPVLINITPDAFPIQKWAYVTVSVSYNFVEAYINGKFMTAVNIHNNSSYGINGVFQAQAPKDINSGATFSFGAKGSVMDNGMIRDNGCPVMLSQLTRWNTPQSAGDIYNEYMKGNGEQGSMFGPSYSLDINLKQDKNVYTLPIF
jgi:hypothetical protein